MATGKEPERRRERKLVTAVADAQDPPLALVCSSCRTPGLRLWPFMVSARNGHTFPFFFFTPLIQQIQIAADLFLFGAPLPPLLQIEWAKKLGKSARLLLRECGLKVLMAIGRLRHSAVAHLAKCFFWLCLFLAAAIVVCCCCYRPLGQSTSSRQGKSPAPFLNQFSRDKNHATVSAHIVHGGRFHLLHVNLSLAKSRALSIPPSHQQQKKNSMKSPMQMICHHGPASLESRDRGQRRTQPAASPLLVSSATKCIG